MTRDEILKILSRHRDRLNELKVKRLALFGSVARGEETLSSDIDIIVVFNEPITLSLYMNLKFFLEDLLERDIDLVTQDAIRPRLRPYIERDLIDVA